MEQEDKIEVKMIMDEKMVNDLKRLTALRRLPNMATAAYEAVKNTLMFYDFQIQGYNVEIKVSRRNDIRRFQLPSIL